MENKEIERKYLIETPKRDSLAARCSHVYAMEQTYLRGKAGVTRRVRKRSENGATAYFYTEKEPVSDCTAVEREREISPAAYEALLKERDPALRTIVKTRYCLPWENHLFEIDLYPFWTEMAVMEVELKEENEAVAFPPEIRIRREVTGDRRFKNVSLARDVPEEKRLLLS